MCVAIPGQIVESSDPNHMFAQVELMGTRRTVNIALLGPSARLGDWILVHAGSAIGHIDELEAQEVLALIEQYAPEPVPN
jgi:hydrogenase expression/formation protein HypC